MGPAPILLPTFSRGRPSLLGQVHGVRPATLKPRPISVSALRDRRAFPPRAGRPDHVHLTRHHLTRCTTVATGHLQSHRPRPLQFVCSVTLPTVQQMGEDRGGLRCEVSGRPNIQTGIQGHFYRRHCYQNTRYQHRKRTCVCAASGDLPTRVDHCAGGRRRGYCLGKRALVHSPLNTTEYTGFPRAVHPAASCRSVAAPTPQFRKAHSARTNVPSLHMAVVSVSWDNFLARNQQFLHQRSPGEREAATANDGNMVSKAGL
ncbi:hypothetical protein Bbelb_201340 [Branchiostoma belcheri]|nr:hypothetical protein Bbelb_201340 [Branchiostoma belcheri]